MAKRNCPVCGRPYATYAGLHHHVHVKHPDVAGRMVPVDDEKRMRAVAVAGPLLDAHCAAIVLKSVRD